MESLLESIRELKTKAKNRRDLERFDSAASFLDKAVKALESALASTTSTEWKAKIASELADCWGLLGGIYRRSGLGSPEPERQALLRKSFESYDTGYQKYEAYKEYKITNSYNRLNRLVSYVLVNPVSLTDSSGGEKLDLRGELEAAGESVRQQLKLERRGDIWAMADLALVDVLLDRQLPAAAYADFMAASPPDYAYDSVLAVLRPLATLPLPVAAKLQEAVQILDGKLQRLRAG